MGEGKERVELVRQSEGIKNLKWLAPGGLPIVKEALRSVDAILISYRPEEILNTGSPNKLFDGLAAGKLIITNFGGWIADLIEKEECGFSYHDINDFKSRIKPFVVDDQFLFEYQENARKLAEREFSVEKVTKSLESFLLDGDLV